MSLAFCQPVIPLVFFVAIGGVWGIYCVGFVRVSAFSVYLIHQPDEDELRSKLPHCQSFISRLGVAISEVMHWRYDLSFFFRTCHLGFSDEFQRRMEILTGAAHSRKVYRQQDAKIAHTH
jgi:hypothetical protein